MKTYKTDSPQFSETLNIVETTDPVHADSINGINKGLFENTLVVKKQIDEVQNTCAKGEGIKFSVENGILTVTYDDGIEENAMEGSE
ncbi:MAG: hypothetical protein K2N51_20920 [Lachnospiraceae bacterium]|nr:hypothetical protein [Lachnospiraceae bacterium]